MPARTATASSGPDDPAVEVVHETSGPRRRRRPIVFGILAMVVALTAGGVTARVLLLADVHTLTGTLLLNDGNEFEAEAGPCAGGGEGHDDLRTGAQVMVQAPNGHVIGAGEFGQGRLNSRGGCVLPFAVTDVEPFDFYRLRSESTLLGGTTYALGALRKDNWKLRLEVGDTDTAARLSRADCLDPSRIDVAGKLVAERVPMATVAPGIKGDLWSYKLIGVITNRTGEDVEVDVAWEIRAYDSLLRKWGPFKDIVGDETLGVDTHRTAGDGTARFTVAGSSEQINKWNDFGKPSRFRTTAESVARAGTGAICS